ncbi:MAG: hypothetical protein HQ521_06685 [Bacteroidetes bacterium]|nr:hypothetical protein [Bacteroidota bacterium]
MTAENELLQIKTAIEAIQKLVEQNQISYTDAKFQQLQLAFSQLKELLGSQIIHNEDLQNQRDKYSSTEFTNLASKVTDYSNSYEKRVTALEEKSVAKDTMKDAVVNILNEKAEKKWAERAIYIVFFLGLVISGWAGYSNLSSTVDTEISISSGKHDNFERRIVILEKTVDQIELIEQKFMNENKDARSKINIDLTKLKQIHKIN